MTTHQPAPQGHQLVVRQDIDPFGTGSPEALRLAQILPHFGGATCELAAAELRRQHAEIERLTVERDAAIDARRAAQLRQEQLTAEIVSLEPMRQREADIERLTSESGALRGVPTELIACLIDARDDVAAELQRCREAAGYPSTDRRLAAQETLLERVDAAISAATGENNPC
jgi:hypothetical protein